MGLFDFLKSKSKKQKLSHLATLNMLMRIDGETSDEEMQLIVRIGTERLGLTQQEITHVLLNKFDDFTGPTSEKEFRTILYDLVFLMMADGIIDEKEYRYCVKFVSIFGYDSTIVIETAREILQSATNDNVDVTGLYQQLVAVSLKSINDTLMD